MIDWTFARATAQRLTPPGPELSAAEVLDVVAELRESAQHAQQPVSEFTGLEPAWAAPVFVVDRHSWTKANLETFRVLTRELEATLSEKGKLPTGLNKAVGEKLAGAEVGTLMSWLSRRVLGQFDPFWEGPDGPGRLLLVAPNVVHVEQQLEVNTRDFRRWVCLHEETHRLQFTGVPWMREHMLSLVGELAQAAGADGAGLTQFVSELLVDVIKILRGDDDRSLADLLHNPQQRQVVERITGLMSLLEGHADVVMDDIGPEFVGSVAEIRRKFNQRRAAPGGLAGILRRLLGFEAKMKQYRDGAEFVRAVIDKAGHDGFSAVWAEAANLPTASEIHDPDSWVQRVHG